MFDFIRSHQRLMQFLLLVLIVPSFALIGVSGYNTYVSGDHDLVKVGRSAITQQEFDNARSSRLRQLEQSNPEGFDPDIMDDPEVRRGLLDSLINQRVVAVTASQERFNVSDAALRRSISAMPELQVEGQFSPERYNEVLAQAGLTTRDFEQGQRTELALARVLEPVTATASLPSTVRDHLGKALTDKRSVSTLSFRAADYTDDVTVSDDEIQEWFNEHRDALQVPEYANIDYLLLDEETVMDGLPDVADDELRDYYEQNRSAFTDDARVNLSHIQINVEAGATQAQRDEAQERATELHEQVQKDPSSFAEVAREHSEDAGTARDGGELGWIRQGSWPASLDKAVFALEKGQISDVIDGPGGYHVFLANDVEEEEVEPFEDVRDQVAEEVRHQLGAERFADIATRLTSLVYDHADSLDPVAQALSLDVRSAKGIGRERLLDQAELDEGDDAAADSPDAEVLDDARVRRAVYSSQVLKEGQNSGVIEISPDTMIAVNVRSHHEAAYPELDRVADQIQDILVQEKAQHEAIKQGQKALADRQDNNEDSDDDLLEQLDDSVTVSRIDPQGMNKQAVDAALALGRDQLPAWTGVESDDGFTILYVTDADHNEPDAELLNNLSSDLARMWGQSEEQAVLEAMRKQAKVELLPEAETAINSSDRDD